MIDMTKLESFLAEHFAVELQTESTTDLIVRILAAHKNIVLTPRYKFQILVLYDHGLGNQIMELSPVEAADRASAIVIAESKAKEAFGKKEWKEIRAKPLQ